MAGKRCAVALFYLWMLLGGDTLARAAGFTHWLVTEEGKIEFQVCTRVRVYICIAFISYGFVCVARDKDETRCVHVEQLILTI